MHLLLFAPRMTPLAHIPTYVNDMEAQVWANQGSVSTASAVLTILKELALATRCHHIHASIGHLLVEENKMVDAASRLTHLTN